MYPRMKDSNPPTTLTAITSFERARSIVLPPGYKAFLLATNGGVPEHSIFPVLGREQDPIDNVQSFLGVGVPEVPTDELAYAYDLYVGGFPAGIIPIANQDSGNYVCLDLRQSKQQVVLWDKRHFWSTGEWRDQDLYKIANSFEEFLSILRPSPN